MSIRDAIFNAKDLRLTAPIDVPEWGVSIRLRLLSVGERLELTNFMAGAEEGRLLFVVTLLFCACDDDGNRLFALDDYDRLCTKCGEVVLKIGRQAAEMNKLVGDPVEEAKKN